MPKKYVDIRFHIEEVFEDFGDESYVSHILSHLERIKTKGVTEDQLDGLAEHVAQEEHYQIYLHPSVVTALASEARVDI